MMTHIAGNVTVKEPVKKWGVLLSRKSQAEDRNCQPACDALQKAKPQPESV